MKRRSMFALVAIFPAALNPAIPAQAETHTITTVLCSGRTVELPLPSQPGTPAPETPCCAKACHTGSSRKRGGCH